MGDLGPDAARFEVPPKGLDSGLRVEVVAALLQRARGQCERPACWVTRPGVPDVHDIDLGWLSAAAAAFDEAGLEWWCHAAVTRTGWLDPRTGDRVVWKRLRLRR